MSFISRPLSSRPRKQRFSHLVKGRTPASVRFDSFSGHSDSEYEDLHRPNSTAHYSRVSRENSKFDRNCGQPTRSDKKARDEHNEQERNRRRELSIIYELIRCCIVGEDMRHLSPGNTPKSVAKLSYPQVLQIAHHIICEEHHNLLLYEKTLDNVKQLEKECILRGLPYIPRPPVPPIFETRKIIVNDVEDLLKHDRIARLEDGSYETSAIHRAAIGDHNLSYLNSRDQSRPPDIFQSHRRSSLDAGSLDGDDVASSRVMHSSSAASLDEL